MNDYAWFKLLVRAIGLLLMGLAIPGIMHTLTSLIHVFGAPMPNMGEFLLYLLIYLGASGLQFAFGAYLLFGGRAVIAFCFRDIEGRCPRCAYEIRSVNSSICPECGYSMTPAAPDPSPGRAQ